MPPSAASSPSSQKSPTRRCSANLGTQIRSGVTQASVPSILIFTDYFLPGYKAGGVLRTLEYLSESLGGEFRFKIVTRDRDLGDRMPYASAARGRWHRIGAAEVAYLAPSERRLGRIREIIRETPHDLLYLTSVFSPTFTIKPLLLRQLGLIPQRPVVLATHGELYPGALESKRLKKRMYLGLVPHTGLYAGVAFQVPDDDGARHLRQWFGESVEAEIGGTLAFPRVSRSVRPEPKQPGRLSLVYLSRIAPHKNLTLALNILRDIRCEVRFDIYGPNDEDPGYWRKCEGLIGNLPDNIRATYRGPVAPGDVCDTLASYDLLFLPTSGENFGHVICESLVAGCPVLTSDRTPWRDLERQGVGWDVPLDAMQRFRAVIEACAAMDESEHGQMRARARVLGARRTEGTAELGQYRALFHGVLAAGA